MIKMKAAEIAKVMGGKYIGPVELEISGDFEFDSREVTDGSVFIALVGEKQDGHDFVEDALSKGAKLSIVTKAVPGNHVIVADVLKAIALLAREVRAKLRGLKVVAITGSQGKTTTKDMLFSILSSEGSTIAPKGSYNNEIGVPITLLRCTEATEYCILELGARHMGDISKLTELAAPSVGVVLKVGTAHLGEFGSRENIAKTKSELIKGLGAEAIAVLGTYDEFTPRMADSLPIKAITFGEFQGADIRAADIELRGGFPAFDLVTPEGREHVELQVLGLHQIANALAAAGAAFALGVSTSDIAAALSLHQSANKWRMELVELHGLTLINDSYNANPESMEAALRTLVLLTQERGGSAWAFLGKMHELGAESDSLHNSIGKLVGELGIDHLVAVGERGYLSGLENGSTETHFFPNSESSFEIIERFAPGDVVLVKASRAEHLEIIATKIIEIWESKEVAEDGGAI